MLDNIFISKAFAQTAESAAAAPETSFASFVPLILIFVIFYFLIVRPQSKKHKEHQQMLGSLKVGTKVVTSSGIVGVVKEIDDKENIVDLEIANGVIVKILKNYVSELVLDKEKAKKEEKNKKKK